MNKIKVTDLSENQLAYAVGIAEIEKGLYTTDPLVAGLPRSFTTAVFAQKNFTDKYEGINTDPVPPFMQDVNGSLFAWGPGEWAIGTFNSATGKPCVTHGPGGKFYPLKNGLYILEREKITTTPGRRGYFEAGEFIAPEGWTAWSFYSQDDESEGCSILDAGLRCYVRSMYGDYINLPTNVK